MADATVETTPADENDDNWLYGDSVSGVNLPDKTSDEEIKETQPSKTADGAGETEEKDQEENEDNDDSHFNDEHFEEVSHNDQEQGNGDADSQENSDSDSDDSIKVTIGEIKSGPQAYASLNIKRGVGLVASGTEKLRSGPTAGKVTLEDFDGPGSINGVPALEFSVENIEDKPWNKPGADISDYFNYGFNEITWSAYCERQRRMRVSEAGVGLHATAPPRQMQSDMRRPMGAVRDDGAAMNQNNYQARENTIQVMTAERREYGRSWRTDGPPEGFAPMPATPEHYYPPAHQPYEESWGHAEQTGWTPTEIKELTPGPMGPPTMGPPPVMVPPPVGMNPPMGPPHVSHPHMPPPHMMPAPSFVSPFRSHPPHMHERDRDRDRERTRERDDRERRERDRREDEEREREREHDRSRSRSIKPDRTREKSYRRERSRSRSRRHKSRSRSPRPPRERSRERERERSPRVRERSQERSREKDRERSVKPKLKENKEKDEEK